MKANKLLWAVFVCSFVLIGGVLGNEFFNFYSELPGISDLVSQSPSSRLALQSATIIVFLFIFFYLASAGFRWLIEFGEQIQKMSFEDKFSMVVGILLGLILTLIVAPLLWHVPRLGVALSILAATFFVYLGIVASLSVKKELPGLIFTRVREEMPSLLSSSPKILDTSVIIDGRIRDVMKTGFIEGQILLPSFVIEELQTIGDSEDPLKRTRGRRGFEILNELRKERGEQIKVIDDPEIPRFEPMDSKLVRLAKKLKAKIITNDSNLSSIANLQGVETLCINELAVALRPIVLPGEKMTVTLVREGKEPGQAVAYLEDGTMVVVDRARHLIGQTVEVEVVSILQTAGGKMIFASPKEEAPPKTLKKPPIKK
ncbi:MAG: PIN/TRAM domain-containing protein [bacterium]